MGLVLQALIELQSVENRLRAAKAKLARCRRNVIIQENQIRTLQNALEAKKEEIQLTTIQSDRLELELKTRDEAITKLRASLNTARTNKEYAAILTAMNTEKADNAKLETEILQLMEEAQNLEDEAVKIGEDRVKLVEDVARAEESLRAFEARSKPERNGLQTQRDECGQRGAVHGKTLGRDFSS